MEKILVINPGSTSTKLAYFNGEELLHSVSITHSPQELKEFSGVMDQFNYRKDAILHWIGELDLSPPQAVVGRGGLLRPMASGTYLVDEAMKEDLFHCVSGEHASNLGGLLADSLAKEYGVKAYIVDPVSVDEFQPIARISGLKEIERRSLVHALNIRAISLLHAKSLDKPLAQCNFIVAHLGGGISIAALEEGKIIDTNDANEMGPFSPERTGQLPVGGLVKLIYEGYYKDWDSCRKDLRGNGGLMAYLGTSDLREVEKRMEEGDEKASLIFSAMTYQIAKEIGSCSAVLKGKVDAILLTGGLANSKKLCDDVKSYVQNLAPFHVYPGEDEMRSLCLGTLRVLRREEEARNYEKEVFHENI